MKHVYHRFRTAILHHIVDICEIILRTFKILRSFSGQQEHENIQSQKLHDFYFCPLLSYVALCQHKMFVVSLFLINLEQVRVFRMLFKLVKTSFLALYKGQYID